MIETIGIVVMIIALAWISRFGRRHNIQEARFDSETGKEIK